jgi:hypothetical protein
MSRSNAPSAAKIVSLGDLGPNGAPLTLEKFSGQRICALISEPELRYLVAMIRAKLPDEVPVDG